MNTEESHISRREALRRLLAGGVLLAGAAMGLPACRRAADTATPATRPAHASASKIACIGCGLCMPCPYGVDIPGNFQVYNDAVSLNELPDPRQSALPDFRRNRLKFLQTYHDHLNHLERADHCIACGRCAQSCPQQLDIPVLLQQIAALAEGLRGR